jgi:D-glycero-D-manno-heptose 1,7-bisphosphate phosphatase
VPINIRYIDKSWTLFLDRDGVINHEKHQDYVHTWEEFCFYDGVKEAISVFAKKFKRIIVVTNQKGVGKGVTKLEDLQLIHKNMTAEIEKEGGRVDRIYFCPDLEETSPNRKPNPGMGLQALKDFDDIDLSKAIMVGNTLSDMQFGRNLGVKTIFLPTTRPEVDLADSRIDAVYESLSSFAKDLEHKQ